MRAKLVRIGNSRGVRLLRALIEQAGIGDEVVLRVRPGEIAIVAVDRPRMGWAEAIAAAPGAPPESEDPFLPTRFDDEEWRW